MNIYQQGGGFLQNSRALCFPVALKKYLTSKISSQKICDTLQGGALLSPNYLSQYYVEIKIVELYHCQC